jgi:hypothetical protein
MNALILTVFKTLDVFFDDLCRLNDWSTPLLLQVWQQEKHTRAPLFAHGMPTHPHTGSPEKLLFSNRYVFCLYDVLCTLFAFACV